MPPTRSRATSLAVAASIALIAGSLAAPVTAADSPEAAVNQLLDAVESGDDEAVDALVCEAERAAVRELLDPSAAAGLEGAGELMTFKIDDRAVDLMEEDGAQATVRLTGTMSIDVAAEDFESLVMALLESEMGELSEEDLDTMLPFIESVVSRSQPMDEELTVVQEGGQWLVCGGLGEAPDETDYGAATSVSVEGLCRLATPEDLTAVGLLEYDTSTLGYGLTSCTYSTSDWDAYHSASVSVELDTDAELVASAWGADQELELAGARAFASETANTPLIVQVGPDMLTISAWAPEPPPEGYEGLEHMVAIAELFATRVAERREELIEPEPPLLCALTFAGEFEAALGLPVHSGSVSGDYCSFESRDILYLNANLQPGTLDDFLVYYPDSTEITVAGLPAVQIDDEYDENAVEIYVELPGEQVLSVSVQPYAYDKPLDIPALEVIELLTQHVVDKQASESTE